MPNRILRDWTDSEKIDKIDVHTERFFTRLIMKVDDFGRYSANCKLLKSTLFPLKSDVRETDITRWLAECEKSGLIALYDVAEKGYLQINDFRQVLRQKKEKYPPPETCLAHDKQMLSRRMVEEKRNETEEKAKDSHPLQSSNLFRKPNIPTFEQVHEKFVTSGGTKEMAEKFFAKHSSVDWFLNGSPITNFANLVPGFITNWNKNNKDSGGPVVNPGQLAETVKAIREQRLNG